MKKKIISVDVNYGNKAHYYNNITQLVREKKNGYVCFMNVHMLIEAHDDEAFSKVVENATITFPDGFPIAKSFYYLHQLKQDRIAGMDFLPEFIQICNDNEFSIAFVGSTPQVLSKVKQKLNADFPKLRITNLICPPFNEQWNNQQYVDDINSTQTDVIFVALGCPKQEKWMYDHHNQIKGLMFGIGGALPTFVGEVPRAPEFMQTNGLEWLFRLIKEPRRMFKRYLYTNTKFIYLLIKNAKG